jgi:hypothetical protein
MRFDHHPDGSIFDYRATHDPDNSGFNICTTATLTTLASTSAPHAALAIPPTTSLAMPASPPASQPVPRVLLAGAVPVSLMVD